MQISIKTASLRAALLAVATKHVRYYLTGVCVTVRDDKTIRIEGTDGKLFFRDVEEGDARDGETAPMQIIIPAQAVKQAVASKPAETLILRRLGDGEYSLGATIFKPIDGCWPDTDRVVPAELSGEGADFDFELCATAQKAMRIATGIKSGVFALKHNGSDAALMRKKDGEHPFCVIAPTRNVI